MPEGLASSSNFWCNQPQLTRKISLSFFRDRIFGCNFEQIT